MDSIADLAGRVSGRVLVDDSAREAVSTDFGRIAARKPAAVVDPASIEDVIESVKFAGRHSLRVAPRGCGHSQSGQSLCEDIVLDMRRLSRIIRVDEERRSVTCQAGATWRALLAQLAPLGLSPPVLTNNLDVTVGGTLSTAGIGVSSWRYGVQADQCTELEVITGDGERVRCSNEENRELFDAVRAGCGWFGVITEATLQLRRHKPSVRIFYLLYDNLTLLFDDLKLLMDEARFDYLEAWCAPLPQGVRTMGGVRQPFAQWFYPLHCTVETDRSGGADESVRGLHFYKHIHTEESETATFFSRLDPLFDLWKSGGFWDMSHPWMECILPWKAAPFYIGRVLESIPPQFLAGGHILLWPARGSATSVPLFVRPEGEQLMGFGILPSMPNQLLPHVLPKLKAASQAAMSLGGKRYISGWLDFGAAGWRSHYGALWPQIINLKRRYDPKQVFHPLPGA